MRRQTSIRECRRTPETMQRQSRDADSQLYGLGFASLTVLFAP
jgi:hypothetical protein